MPDPNDPILQAIDDNYSEGMSDPSRAAAIMRMLPQLVGAKPNIRPIGNYSGLPQTGGQALADVGSLAGQGPSGLPGDVKMGTNLGEIYQNRAQLAQRGDIFSNELEGRRVAEENLMTRARGTQTLEALKLAQQEKMLAQQIEANKRLLATDARMRLEFIGNSAKAAGAPDSPEYRAYLDHFMKTLRDPVRRKALENPDTGIAAMTTIMDEALQASRVPAQAPTPRAERAVSTAEGVSRPSTPGSAPANFPTVAPTEQAARDALRGGILADEQAGRVKYDPITSIPQKPVYPPSPFRNQGEGDAAFAKRQSEHGKIVSDMSKEYQQESIRYNEDLRKQREDEVKIRKDEETQQVVALDARKLRDAVTSKLSNSIATIDELQKAKGLPKLVGALDAWTPDISQDAQDAVVIYQNIISGQVMEVLNDLKAQSKTGATGFGALSENELKLIKNAAGKLSRRQSEPQFKKHLDEYRAQLEKTLRGVDRDYQSGPWAKKEPEARNAVDWNDLVKGVR